MAGCPIMPPHDKADIHQSRPAGGTVEMQLELIVRYEYGDYAVGHRDR